MNKRQAKKTRKKVVYPLVDEFNLISMTAEEIKDAYKEYNDYVQKHFRYFHYQDRRKVAMKPCLYRFPVGEAVRKYCDEILKLKTVFRSK